MSPDTRRLWQLQPGCAHRAAFSILPHFQRGGQRRVQAPIPPQSTPRLAEQAAVPQCCCCACHQQTKLSASQVEADCARAPSTLQLHCSTGGRSQRVKPLRGGLCVCVCLPFSTHLSHFASCFGAVPARGPGQQHAPF